MKKAVIYYSLSGNTKGAAEYVAKETGADLFEIDLVKAMPEGMGKQIMYGGMLVTFGVKAKIKNVPENLSDYDEIILGTPIWAGKVAAPINTLISKYGIADKVATVFTLSGGGDNDKCIAALSKQIKNLKASVALADRSNELSAKNEEKLKQFVKELNM